MRQPKSYLRQRYPAALPTETLVQAERLLRDISLSEKWSTRPGGSDSRYGSCRRTWSVSLAGSTHSRRHDLNHPLANDSTILTNHSTLETCKVASRAELIDTVRGTLTKLSCQFHRPDVVRSESLYGRRETWLSPFLKSTVSRFYDAR